MSQNDRVERHLMRQRGAGVRTVSANFGFSLAAPPLIHSAPEPILLTTSKPEPRHGHQLDVQDCEPGRALSSKKKGRNAPAKDSARSKKHEGKNLGLPFDEEKVGTEIIAPKAAQEESGDSFTTLAEPRPTTGKRKRDLPTSARDFENTAAQRKEPVDLQPARTRGSRKAALDAVAKVAAGYVEEAAAVDRKGSESEQATATTRPLKRIKSDAGDDTAKLEELAAARNATHGLGTQPVSVLVQTLKRPRTRAAKRKAKAPAVQLMSCVVDIDTAKVDAAVVESSVLPVGVEYPQTGTSKENKSSKPRKRTRIVKVCSPTSAAGPCRGLDQLPSLVLLPQAAEKKVSLSQHPNKDKLSESQHAEVVVQHENVQSNTPVTATGRKPRRKAIGKKDCLLSTIRDGSVDAFDSQPALQREPLMERIPNIAANSQAPEKPAQARATERQTRQGRPPVLLLDKMNAVKLPVKSLAKRSKLHVQLDGIATPLGHDPSGICKEAGVVEDANPQAQSHAQFCPADPTRRLGGRIDIPSGAQATHLKPGSAEAAIRPTSAAVPATHTICQRSSTAHAHALILQDMHEEQRGENDDTDWLFAPHVAHVAGDSQPGSERTLAYSRAARRRVQPTSIGVDVDLDEMLTGIAALAGGLKGNAGGNNSIVEAGGPKRMNKGRKKGA